MGRDGVDTDLWDDDDVALSVRELGEPDLMFRVSRARFFTKLALGIGLLGAGLIANYFWWFVGPAAHNHLILILLLGMPFTGGALLWHMYQQRGLVVLVYPNGLLRLRRGEVDSYPWAEIDYVRVKVQKASSAEIERDADGSPTACWLPADAPTFQLWKSGLCVARGDGVEARFSAALTDYARLSEEVQKRTFTALWPKAWERFLAGIPQAFGDLEVSLKGIRQGGKLIRWDDVKDLSIMQEKLRIKQGSKRFKSAFVDLYSITNPHLLFALVKEAQRAAAA